jgi:hypothetical protein
MLRGRIVRLNALIVVSKRHAGGGGRPSARPTFSWKERNALGLQDKQRSGVRKNKLGVRGDASDMEEFLAATDVDVKEVDVLAQSDGWESIDRYVDDKLTINPANLFGPDKSRGRLIKKRNYNSQRFSHSRIFGKKGQNKGMNDNDDA